MTGGRLKRVLPLRRRATTSASPTATGWPTWTSARCIGVPSRAGHAGDRDRGAARPAASERSIRGRAGRRLRGEAAGRRRLDQRRVLRPLPGRRRVHRGATRRSGSASRSSGSPREGQLAAYKHDGFWHPMDTHARHATPGGSLGHRPRRPGRRGSGPLVLGAGAACSSPATRASRAAGSRSGCSALGAEVIGLLARPCRPSPRCSSCARVGDEMESVEARRARRRGGARGDRATRGPRS